MGVPLSIFGGSGILAIVFTVAQRLANGNKPWGEEKEESKTGALEESCQWKLDLVLEQLNTIKTALREQQEVSHAEALRVLNSCVGQADS